MPLLRLKVRVSWISSGRQNVQTPVEEKSLHTMEEALEHTPKKEILREHARNFFQYPTIMQKCYIRYTKWKRLQL